MHIETGKLRDFKKYELWWVYCYEWQLVFSYISNTGHIASVILLVSSSLFSCCIHPLHIRNSIQEPNATNKNTKIIWESHSTCSTLLSFHSKDLQLIDLSHWLAECAVCACYILNAIILRQLKTCIIKQFKILIFFFHSANCP